MTSPHIQAVLFDLDGTLLDTAQDLGDAVNVVLSAFHFPLHTPEEIRSFIGQGIKEFVKSALPSSDQSDEMIEHCYQLMQKEYALRWKDHTKPFPQVPELLHTLWVNHIQTAILSNKEDFFTKEIVAILLSDCHFNVVQGSTPQIPAKPDPTGAKTIAATLHIDPSQFLYLGDSSIDIETATNVGMQPVWAMWGYGNKQFPMHKVIKIQYPLELLSYLGR